MSSRVTCTGLRALTLLVVVSLAPTPGSAQIRDLLPFGRTHRIAQVLPTVVNISVIELVPDPADPAAPPRRVEHFGSGFIVDPSGIIVTNRHVINGVSEINVTVSAGTIYKAKLLATTTRWDIALLKIDGPKPFPAIKWGDSSRLRIGDQVMAVGNPLGVGQSVSDGIVSGLNRNISVSSFDDFIQTDAAINHGNSGGALVDTHGDVIGINTALYSPTDSGSIGIGFAIPSNDAQFAVTNMLKNGRLKIGYVGIRMQDVTTDMGEALGLKPARGAIVAGIEMGSPAAKTALAEGDVILKFGDQTPKDIRALSRLIAEAKLGATVVLTVWRAGTTMTMPLLVMEWVDEVPKTLADAEVPKIASADPAVLGFEVALVTPEAAAKFMLASGTAGPLVAGVTNNGVAWQHGVRAGDVILRVQRDEVATPEQVRQRLEEARGAKRKFVLVLLQRQGGQNWVTLPVYAE